MGVMVMEDTLENGTETMDMVALDCGELIVVRDLPMLMHMGVMVMEDTLENGTETMDIVALDYGELTVVRDLLMPAMAMVVVTVGMEDMDVALEVTEEDMDEDLEVTEEDMVAMEVVMDTESKIPNHTILKLHSYLLK